MGNKVYTNDVSGLAYILARLEMRLGERGLFSYLYSKDSRTELGGYFMVFDRYAPSRRHPILSIPIGTISLENAGEMDELRIEANVTGQTMMRHHGEMFLSPKDANCAGVSISRRVYVLSGNYKPEKETALLYVLVEAGLVSREISYRLVETSGNVVGMAIFEQRIHKD